MHYKSTKIFRILQSNSFAFQSFQVFRHASILLAAIALTWIDPSKSIINQYESLILIGGSTTFFWITGLLDGFLLLHRQAGPLSGKGIELQTLASALVLGLLSALAFWGIAQSELGSGLSPLSIHLFAIFLLLDSVSNLLSYSLIARDRSLVLISYGFVSALANFLALVLPIYLGYSLEIALGALLAVASARFIWLLALVGLHNKGAAWNSNQFKQLLRLSTPLAIAALLSQSALYLDGYLVKEYFPQGFADFRYGARELPFVMLLANSMSVVRSAEVADGKSKGDVTMALSGLRSGTNRLIWMLFPVSVGLLLFSQPLFDIVFKQRFGAAVPVFDVYLLLIVPRLMFPQAIVRGFHRTIVMTASAAIELVFKVAISLILMQYFGMVGIAAGTVIAFLLEKLILVWYTKRYLGVAWSEYASLKLWWIWSLALIGVWAIKYFVWMPIP